MDNQNNEVTDLIGKARDALRRGDKETAHKLGEQAALLAPDREDAWLILTATEPNPEDALAYAQQALEIDPTSARALKAVEWAIAQLKQAQASGKTGETAAQTAAAGVAVVPVSKPPEQSKADTGKKSNIRPWIFAAVILGLLLCAAIVFAAYAGVTRIVSASFVNKVSAPAEETLWAPMNLAKPSAAPAGGSVPDQQADGTTPTAGPTQESTILSPSKTPVFVLTEAPALLLTETPTSTPSETPTEAAIATPGVTETPGAMSMQIVADTPTSQYVAPASPVQLPEVASSGNGVRWIDVDLTNQRVYAYEDGTVVNSFTVSTGTWLTPTVTGEYKIYVKYRSAPMSGPGYYLPDVPYIMYFYKGYGLHGTYWHNNFGTPMSHGCVNLRTDEAAWLYNWSSVGTLVNVHY